MSKQTLVYAITFYCWNDERNNVSFSRHDPRTVDREVSRSYRHFTCASIRRVQRLMQRLIGDGEAVLLPDGRARIGKRFAPSPLEVQREAQ